MVGGVGIGARTPKAPQIARQVPDWAASYAYQPTPIAMRPLRRKSSRVRPGKVSDRSLVNDFHARLDDYRLAEEADIAAMTRKLVSRNKSMSADRFKALAMQQCSPREQRPERRLARMLALEPGHEFGVALVPSVILDVGLLAFDFPHMHARRAGIAWSVPSAV